MAVSPNSTILSRLPKTIEAICRAWQASEARLNLECIEAGEDDELIAAACDRDTQRTDRLFEKLQKMKAVSDDNISDQLHLARLLLEFSWENAEGIKVILQMASNALHHRKILRAA
jgi:hypothetical protein